MSISDWSSDVCSSDLQSAGHRGRTGLSVPGPPRHSPAMNEQREIFDRRVQIGRESCRERVCQYVSISVVAVSLKKKKNQELTTSDNSEQKQTTEHDIYNARHTE